MNNILRANMTDWFATFFGCEESARREKARKAKAQTAAQGMTRVLVCGASGAIGAAVAEHFAAQGAQLFLHYRSSAAAIDKLVQEMPKNHPGTPAPFTAQADLRDEETARYMVQEAYNRMGGIDVLVTSIGVADDKPLLMTCSEDVHACMDDNLRTIINVCEAFKVLPRNGRAGRIVNISSVTGLVGQPMRVAYGAAKGAVISYTKSLARDLAHKNITANIVAPQVVEGGLANVMKPAMREALFDSTPIGRFCTAPDVAHAVGYLASPGASFVTGTVLTIAGGLVTW